MQTLRLQKIDSTNLEAKRLWLNSTAREEPFAVIAHEQEAGFGRNGRRWNSPKGGLWMTLVWPIQKPLEFYQPLPLIIGYCLCNILESVYNLNPLIKWPNDVLLDERKVAGILCQTINHSEATAIMIGIGVNGNFKAHDLGQNLRMPATTLFEQLNDSIDLIELDEELTVMLESQIHLFEMNGFDNFVGRINQRLAWLNKTISYASYEKKQLEGILEGIDKQGHLLIKTAKETTPFFSGEISEITPYERKEYKE